MESSYNSQKHIETLEITKPNFTISMKKLGWDQQGSNLLILGRTGSHTYILLIPCQELQLSLCNFVFFVCLVYGSCLSLPSPSAIQIFGFCLSCCHICLQVYIDVRFHNSFYRKETFIAIAQLETIYFAVKILGFPALLYFFFFFLNPNLIVERICLNTRAWWLLIL